ncbi:MAG TPA: DUF1232 domain-containing protein [Gaiellaceae bacterium]|jgi:uncharacterized membrane protein YkvA (DUF1232 family)
MAALWVVVIVGLLLLGRGRDARYAARFIPDCLVLFKRLLRDERVPRRAKIAVALLIPYLALPIDLIPDFIPIVGQLDDALLVLVTLGYVARTAGREVITELWPGSERALRVVLVLA